MHSSQILALEQELEEKTQNYLYETQMLQSKISELIAELPKTPSQSNPILQKYSNETDYLENPTHHPKSSISLAKQIPMIDTMIFNEMDGTWDSDDYIDEAPFYITDN